jgi:pyrroline-5-carboxylate reductase
MNPKRVQGREGIGFLGAGQMGEALIQGILAAGLYRKDRICAADFSGKRLEDLKNRYGIRVTEDNRKAVDASGIIILSVKPNIVDRVVREIAPRMDDSKLIVSIAAGIPIGRILASLGKKARVVRVMPNTPALLRQGASALAPGEGVSPEDLERVRKIFEAVGRVVVLEERYLDAVTGLSGSGPAFVFMAIEALSDGGVKMGLSRETATLLSAQTVLGAAAMVLQTGEHPGVLKDRVASPEGTTIAGIHHLEECGFRAALMGAVEAATRRSVELGKKTGS